MLYEEPIESDTQRKLQELSLKILQQYKDKYDIKELEKQAVISEACVQAARDAAAISRYYDDKLETTHTELNELKDKEFVKNTYYSISKDFFLRFIYKQTTVLLMNIIDEKSKEMKVRREAI